MMINIILAEDQTMLREAMVQLINLNEQLEVVGSSGNGKEAYELIKVRQPQVAIIRY